MLGLFESDWGVRFVVDAGVWQGRVYNCIVYSGRPSRACVRAKARKWGLRTLYTRLKGVNAIQLVKNSDLSRTEEGGPGLDSYTILGAAANLAQDSLVSQGWYFAFYVRRSGNRAAARSYGHRTRWRPSRGSLYFGGEYGFGATPHLCMSRSTESVRLGPGSRQIARLETFTRANTTPRLYGGQFI